VLLHLTFKLGSTKYKIRMSK